MDLTRAITYRGIDVNGAAAQLGKPGIVGISIEGVDVSPIETLQYMDKMYQQQGMDFQGVGNLMVAARTIDLAGTIYGDTRGDMWDRLHFLREALDPTLAYAADQANMGFLPLAWKEVTTSANVVVDRFVYALSNGVRDVIDRDKQGTNIKTAPATPDVFGQPAHADKNALALRFTTHFQCRDPRVYGDLHTINLATTTSGTLTNAGDYPTLVDLTLVLGPDSGPIDVGVGGANFTIPTGFGTSGRTVRYRGWTKLLTLVDSALQGTKEILRMDMLVFDTPNSDTQHPSILPGASAWHVTAGGSATILSGSTLVYRDAYA